MVKHANYIPLGKLQRDIDLAVNCVTEGPNPRLAAGGSKTHKGPSSIVSQRLENYRAARHQKIKEMILKGEEKFGIYIEPVNNNTH